MRTTTIALALTGLFGSAIACTARESPPPDPEAAFRAQLGREWELTRIGTQEIPPPAAGTRADSPGADLVPGRRPTITFTAEPSRFGGRSFCNGYGGPFTLSGDSLRITEIMGTAVGCDGEDSLETRFFRGLHAPIRFEIDSASLVLIGTDGTRLTFVPSAPHARP